MRPVPEAVRVFMAELDPEKRAATRLLQTCERTRGGSERFINNVAALLCAYQEPQMLEAFLRIVPNDTPLGFRVEGIDLRGSEWRGRYLHGMEFETCVLDEADFSGTHISDLRVVGTSLHDADFRDARIESMTIDNAERVFGRAESLALLARLGAHTGLERASVRASIMDERRSEIVALVRGRLNRFYVPGSSDAEDSRWDSSIQERNIYGGMRQGDAKFIRSKVVPRMVSSGILERTRRHGLVIYHLTDVAKDDARALIERDEVTGYVGELIERLLGREPAVT
jgi:hypothetical protein